MLEKGIPHPGVRPLRKADWTLDMVFQKGSQKSP